MSCVNETTIFGDRNFPLATILKMKVAKRRLIEKMSLERWVGYSRRKPSGALDGKRSYLKGSGRLQISHRAPATDLHPPDVYEI